MRNLKDLGGKVMQQNLRRYLSTLDQDNLVEEIDSEIGLVRMGSKTKTPFGAWYKRQLSKSSEKEILEVIAEITSVDSAKFLGYIFTKEDIERLDITIADFKLKHNNVQLGAQLWNLSMWCANNESNQLIPWRKPFDMYVRYLCSKKDFIHGLSTRHNLELYL